MRTITADKIRLFINNIIFFFFEFVFFFSSYWWWKMQWLLSREYSRASGYEIYNNAKADIQEKSEKNFSYGETTALSAKLLLQEINPAKGSVVYDLGSGRGTFLFSAYFLYELRGVGIELFSEYTKRCINICKRLSTPAIMFRQGDLTKADVSEADIIYIAGTTFEADVVDALRENLVNAKPGAIIISLTHKYPEDKFTLIKEGKYPFSWGTEDVYFYKRKEE